MTLSIDCVYVVITEPIQKLLLNHEVAEHADHLKHWLLTANVKVKLLLFARKGTHSLRGIDK